MIRQTIHKSLVDMQHFMHEFSSILCKTSKKRNKIRRHSITCSHIWHFDISILIRQSVKFWWRYNNSDMNAQKRNKIKMHSITCSHIWYVNISKCVYWLDTHSVKVWCYQTQMPLIFVIYFSDIRQCSQPARKNGLVNQKSGW